jgi:hypothetical protein
MEQLGEAGLAARRGGPGRSADQTRIEEPENQRRRASGVRW